MHKKLNILIIYDINITMITRVTFIETVYADTYKDGRKPSETNQCEFSRILWEAELRHLLSKKGIPPELADNIVAASEPEHLISLGPNGQRIKAKICQKAYFQCMSRIVNDQLKIYSMAAPILVLALSSSSVGWPWSTNSRLLQEARAIEDILQSKWF